MIRSLLTAALALLLAACSSLDTVPARNKAARLSAEAGWTYGFSSAGSFAVATALSPVRGGGVLTVYLEGDGLAYVGTRTVSADPTPSNPLALRLALAQPGTSGAMTAYVARPCQYSQSQGLGRNCQPAYWTSHRYAPEVVASVSGAIDDLKRRSGAQRLVLVGYSGGAVIGALLAAQRQDVAGLITVAGNLDPTYWVSRDRLAPLSGSLDPLSFAGVLKTVPQFHYAGAADQVVTPDVVASYVRKLGPGAPVTMVEMPGFNHDCCWLEQWPGLFLRAQKSIMGHR